MAVVWESGRGLARQRTRLWRAPCLPAALPHEETNVPAIINLVVCLSVLAGDVPAGETSHPRSPAEALRSFQLPEDLEMELVAAEPLVVDPTAIAFDAQGRLFATEYRDYPTGPEEGQSPLSRIRLLEDTDGDGRMDRGHTFADQLSFAQSLMPWNDGLLVTAGGQTERYDAALAIDPASAGAQRGKQACAAKK